MRYRLGIVDGSIADHADFTGMLCIPYLTRKGGVNALKFRQPHECSEYCDHPKYMTPHPTRIYNTIALDMADRLGYAGIAEGEFDALVLDALCGIPSVGIPGVKTWTQHLEWKEIFRGYDRVLVFADKDEPGRELAKAIMRDLENAHVISLQSAKDVNLAYLAEGPEAIRYAAGVQ